MFSSMFMGDSKVFDGYLKDISRLFLGVLTLLGMGGALCARIVFILRFPKFFNSNYVLKFFDFSYNYITFMITTKKGVWEVSGGCLDGVWGLSGGISGSG